jgi:hypothetical protein
MKSVYKQYLGYRDTPQLWEGMSEQGLEQFKMPLTQDCSFGDIIDENLRLGKRVERFVSFELNQLPDVEIIVENIQIQQEKRTLGELDCILKHGNTYIHLEIVYKFYLYDPEVGTTEYEHWIGPNRKDCLIDKLSKLKDKQLPLLYRPETLNYLNTLQLNPDTVSQQVYFKAQLFVPYKQTKDVCKALNPACIAGFYVHYGDLHHFADCKFYIPEKVNWLCAIETQIAWLTYSRFLEIIEPVMCNKTAPLCWVKQPNGLTKKCFVVWW